MDYDFEAKEPRGCILAKPKLNFFQKRSIGSFCWHDVQLEGGNGQGRGKASSYLKLKKFEVRHFSGQRREYSAWKRDFREIVVVPGRPDSEIGFTLKSSIPQKYHYLFDNISLAEHSKMFTILDEKFGKARLIIDETVAEMERIKPVTNDKEFVVFVDKIEKIYRDLNELSLTSEIHNASVLRCRS